MLVASADCRYVRRRRTENSEVVPVCRLSVRLVAEGRKTRRTVDGQTVDKDTNNYVVAVGRGRLRRGRNGTLCDRVIGVCDNRLPTSDPVTRGDHGHRITTWEIDGEVHQKDGES